MGFQSRWVFHVVRHHSVRSVSSVCKPRPPPGARARGSTVGFISVMAAFLFVPLISGFRVAIFLLSGCLVFGLIPNRLRVEG